MRSLVAILCLVFALTGRASTAVSEITDDWYTVGEDGWGLNIILQNYVGFATFYIYDTNRNPVWYTAVLESGANFIFSGSLYANRGPWFGGAYNQSTVVERQAGTATFVLHDLNNATLTYTVDGVVVVKQLQRLTFRLEDYSGDYAGGYSIRTTACAPSSLNGIQEIAGSVSVSHTGSAMRIVLNAGATGSCTFNGTYSQYGKLGQLDGTYSCTDSTFGTFTMFEMTPTISGFTGRAQGQNQFCQWSGYFGGIARAK